MKHTSFAALTLLLVAIPLLTAGCLAPLSHDPALTARWDEILTRHADTGAIVTARVLELPERRELYAREIDKPYTPASNAKLPVSATGLDMFGLDHTFKTYLAVDGNDLWIIGTGDPGIGDPRLSKRDSGSITGVFDEWADALANRGLKQFGDIYYYDDALDKEWLHPSWGEDVLHWYGAPTSGLNFNDNCIDITIQPTTAGQPVSYTVVPPVRNITVINECVTGDKHEPTIEKLPEGDVYKIGGTCAEVAELKSKPVTNPGAFFCDAFRTHLAGRGMIVAGEIKHTEQPLGGDMVPPADKLVATHETPLRDVIDRINTNSQNFFAEALCKLTGQAWAAKQGRVVPGSWHDGGQAIHAFLRANGIDDRHYIAADGSGLSDLNKLTSRLLTDLLAVMMERPDGHAYLDSLAKGGVNGSLEERFADSEGYVFAKTGYIGGVRALSGYVRTRDDHWLAFSIIYNRIPGSVKPYEELQDEAVNLLIDWPNIEE
ncbi:MAG: D-alanyl-D-alanine carboxypeptidase/D-alanyl-D-alanine-endopeptidase [Phycisphaerae bacterium]|nr:D-alanyl-D-alanine carboxypeptidase/D-alanyl-D-alanine-endopeptidase [Phycisphaerae bacterium]